MQANEYPFVTEIEVAFRDLDALGHVNNAVYLSYLEHARLKTVLAYTSAHNMEQIPLIVGTITIRYISPAHLGEMLLVGMGISRFGNKSFDIAYQIDTNDGRAVANATITMVYFNYESNQTEPIPAQFRNYFLEKQVDWQLAADN